MPDIQVQPDHYDYVMPEAADPDSSLPLELDEPTAREETRETVSTDLGGSLADRLRRDLATPTIVPTIDVPVPGREGWSLRFRLDWNESKAEKWRKQAKDKSFESGISNEKLAAALLADQCTAILIDGQMVVIQGERWTFASKTFQQEVGVGTATQAVRKVIPLSSPLLDVADQVSAAARQGDVLDPM